MPLAARCSAVASLDASPSAAERLVALCAGGGAGASATLRVEQSAAERAARFSRAPARPVMAFRARPCAAGVLGDCDPPRAGLDGKTPVPIGPLGAEGGGTLSVPRTLSQDERRQAQRPGRDSPPPSWPGGCTYALRARSGLRPGGPLRGPVTERTEVPSGGSVTMWLPRMALRTGPRRDGPGWWGWLAPSRAGLRPVASPHHPPTTSSEMSVFGWCGEQGPASQLQEEEET